eukprot:gene26608-53559_t
MVAIKTIPVPTMHTTGLQNRLDSLVTEVAVLSQLRHDNILVGTPLPEACEARACAESDIWAVGITVVEMLTGDVPIDLRPALRHDGELDVDRFVHLVLPYPHAAEFATACLSAVPADRPTAADLLLARLLTQ